MYLQANKPLFPLARLRRRPPEELSAGRGKKAEEKKEVTEAFGSPLSAFFHLFPNLLDLLLWYEEVQNAVKLLRVGQAAGVLRTEHVECYVYQLAEDQVFNNLLIVD